MCKFDAGAMQLYWEECTTHRYSRMVINDAKVPWLCREECTTHQYSRTVINDAKVTLNIAISARIEVCSIQTEISQYCIVAHRVIMQSCWVACESCFLSYKQQTLFHPLLEQLKLSLL